MIVGVILAAGESRRMGRLKQLLPFGEHTVIERVVQSYLPHLSKLHVILGHEHERILSVIQEYPVAIHLNVGYREGMLSSVQCAVQVMPADVQAMLVGLVDQPLIDTETVALITQAFIDDQITIPTYGGRRGHPVLIPQRYFAEIMELRGEMGGLRVLMRRHASLVHELPLDDPAILWDLDTPEDYQQALEHLKTSRGSR